MYIYIFDTKYTWDKYHYLFICKNIADQCANKLLICYIQSPSFCKFHSVLTSRNKKTLTRSSRCVITYDGYLEDLANCESVCVKMSERGCVSYKNMWVCVYIYQYPWEVQRINYLEKSCPLPGEMYVYNPTISIYQFFHLHKRLYLLLGFLFISTCRWNKVKLKSKWRSYCLHIWHKCFDGLSLE